MQTFGIRKKWRRRSVKLSAMLQEADTGTLAAVERETSDSTDDKHGPDDFSKLARTSVFHGTGIRALGAGLVLTESCRRTLDQRLSFGKAKGQVTPQAFAWEKLRAPVLVEDFAEVQARMNLLPPRSLRPRRIGEDFHVLAVAHNSAANYDSAEQMLVAELLDATGQSITLKLPWMTRGKAGFERLAAGLLENSGLFVSGTVSLAPTGLTIIPAGVVFKGDSRVIVQPWVDEPTPMPIAAVSEANFPIRHDASSSAP